MHNLIYSFKLLISHTIIVEIDTYNIVFNCCIADVIVWRKSIPAAATAADSLRQLAVVCIHAIISVV
jgi:hypothetical protein